MKSTILALAALGFMASAAHSAPVQCDRGAVFQTCNGAANNDQAGRRAEQKGNVAGPVAGGGGTATPPGGVDDGGKPGDQPGKGDKSKHPNNGHGNGDQTAPGNSGSHNNAENSSHSGQGNSAGGQGKGNGKN